MPCSLKLPQDTKLAETKGMAKKVCDSLKELPSKRTVKFQRKRVSDRLLRVPVPWKYDLEDAKNAEIAVSQGLQAQNQGLQAQTETWDWGPKSKTWSSLLYHVKRSHIGHILQELGPFTILSPIYPPESVQNAFLESCSNLEHSISVGYHGTAKHNISSITKHGLLKPGSHGVKVVHGSAHGVGIYTAQLGAASLSKGFCDSDRILICAICDTSGPYDDSVQRFVPSQTHVMTKFPKRINYNGHQKIQESKEVLHVGSAMVVFNEKCVVPLFVATNWHTTADVKHGKWEPAQVVGKRQIAIPHDGDPGVIFSQDGKPRVGRTVWMPPMPVIDAPSWQKAVQRRRYRKFRHKDLRKSRDEKNKIQCMTYGD